MEKSSADPFPVPALNPALKISQPDRGYRFSMDPLILAAHVLPADNEKIIDLGCGCGIISLILASRYPGLDIVGVEIQEELAEFARQNIVANRLEQSIRIIHDDIKNLQPHDMDGEADIIVSNPPYKRRGSGRLNPDSQKAIARHEIFLDLDTLFQCSSRLLGSHGRIHLIFPADRMPDLTPAMAPYQFTMDTLRFVHIRRHEPAKLALVCARKDSRQNCRIEPPLYIYSSKDTFTHEYADLMK